ncbi:MAG: hypothetical protein NTZ13_04280 [Candidatus Parcubacteria bacterium]|nr:hypothetical protein [Candidatus Parcubacteria bacterium]
MNYVLYIFGVFGIVLYLWCGYYVSGKIYDLYYAAKKPSWLIRFLVWPIATISDRRNLKNDDWRYQKSDWEDCYAYLLPNRTTRDQYISIMMILWGVKIVWNLIIFSLIFFLLLMAPIGAGLALAIAIPLKKLIGRE